MQNGMRPPHLYVPETRTDCGTESHINQIRFWMSVKLNSWSRYNLIRNVLVLKASGYVPKTKEYPTKERDRNPGLGLLSPDALTSSSSFFPWANNEVCLVWMSPNALLIRIFPKWLEFSRAKVKKPLCLSAVSKWEIALWKLYGRGSSQCVHFCNSIVSCCVCFPENFPWLLPLCLNSSYPVAILPTVPLVCNFFPVYFAVSAFPDVIVRTTSLSILVSVLKYRCDSTNCRQA